VYYNIWNIRYNRWTNAYLNGEGRSQDSNKPKRLSKAEAEKWLRSFSTDVSVFEIRPLQAIPKDQKCNKCNKPCPHTILNNNTCSSCIIMMELENGI
jgi:hypothetical protein